MFNHPIIYNTTKVVRLFVMAMAMVVSPFFSITSLHSQTPDVLPQKHAVVAAKLCQEKQYLEAKSEIELALQDELENSDSYTWYIRGFIYKELYKTSTDKGEANALREESVLSLLKSNELANDTDANNSAALNYLASTYFRDAIAAASSTLEVSDSSCFQLFDAYKNILSVAVTEQDVKLAYIELLHTRGRALLGILAKDRCHEINFLAVKGCYNEILMLNPKDCVALYNLAITYYNTAVFSNDNKPDVRCYDVPERENLMSQARALLMDMDVVCDDKQSLYKALVNVLRASGKQDEANEVEIKLKAIQNTKDN